MPMQKCGLRLTCYQTVRRDNCRLVSTVISTCLNKMLIDRDVEGAIEYTKQIISDLLQNKVDMSQLVITKALAKAGAHQTFCGEEATADLFFITPRLCRKAGSR